MNCCFYRLRNHAVARGQKVNALRVEMIWIHILGLVGECGTIHRDPRRYRDTWCCLESLTLTLTGRVQSHVIRTSRQTRRADRCLVLEADLEVEGGRGPESEKSMLIGIFRITAGTPRLGTPKFWCRCDDTWDELGHDGRRWGSGTYETLAVALSRKKCHFRSKHRKASPSTFYRSIEVALAGGRGRNRTNGIVALPGSSTVQLIFILDVADFLSRNLQCHSHRALETTTTDHQINLPEAQKRLP